MHSPHGPYSEDIGIGGSSTALMRRIWAEFMEMPGLGLTRSQAQRLCGLDERTCIELLDQLVALKFLTCGIDGRYRRVSDGRDGRTPGRMAKGRGMGVFGSPSAVHPRHKKSA